MRKWIAAAVAVAGLAVFGGTALAQQDTPQDPAQQPGTQQQEQQNRQGGWDCPEQDDGGQQDGGQQSSPETEV